MSEQLIGRVIHYWGNIEVAGVDITDGELSLGDEIRFKGHTTDFTQRVESVQIDLQDIEKAKKGDSIGLKVIQKVREHDEIYKIVPE